MAEIRDWDNAAANNNDAPPNGAPENMAYSAVNDTIREIMAVLSRHHDDDNGSLSLGGTANVLTLTSNATRTSNVRGDRYTVVATLTNTGNTTLNVNSIGAVAVEKPDGTALTGGEIQAGGVYEIVFDGTNFQILGVPGAFLELSGGGRIVDLTDSEAPLVIGDGAAVHMEADANDLQTKSNATTAATLNLNRLGGQVNVGSQSAGSDGVSLYFNGAVVAQSQTGGFRVNDDSGAAPRLDLYDDSSTLVARIQETSAEFLLQGLVHGNPFRVNAEDAGGVNRVLIDADPDSATSLYAAGSLRLQATSLGRVSVRSDGSTDSENRQIRLEHSDSTLRALIGHAGSAALNFQNEINSGTVLINARTAGGTQVNLFNGAPDGNVLLYYSGEPRLITQSAGRVGVRSTTSTDTENRHIRLEHGDGTLRALVGHSTSSTLRFQNEINSGDVQLNSRNSAGTLVNLLVGNPDSFLTLYHNGNDRLRASNTGLDILQDDDDDANDTRINFLNNSGVGRGLLGFLSNGDIRIRNQVHSGHVILEGENAGGNVRTMLEGDSDDEVDLYHPGSNQIELSTRQHDAVLQGSGAVVRHPDGNLYSVGFNVLPEHVISSDETLSQSDMGKMMVHTENNARTINLDNDPTFLPDGALFTVINVTNTLTIDPDVGTTIRHFDGTAWVDTTGTIAMADGVVNIWKQDATLYYVWGSGT